MPKIETSALTGPALDWAVAKAEGHAPNIQRDFVTLSPIVRGTDWDRAEEHSPSTDWLQGGPIIEQMRGIKLKSGRNPKAPCYAHIVGYNGVERWHQTGKTLLIAAMRCYVASKLGDEVDVPEELT